PRHVGEPAVANVQDLLGRKADRITEGLEYGNVRLVRLRGFGRNDHGEDQRVASETRTKEIIVGVGHRSDREAPADGLDHASRLREGWCLAQHFDEAVMRGLSIALGSELFEANREVL